MVFMAVAAAHILFVKIPEKKIAHDPELENKKIDLKGSMAAIRAVPGLAWLLGDGEARGIALVFLVASIIMLVVVLLAFKTRAYRRLSEFYQKA